MSEPAEPPVIHDLVVADIRARQEQGLAEYGRLHRPHNGLDGLVEAYEEALDMAFWLRQEIEERTALMAEVAELRAVRDRGVW